MSEKAALLLLNGAKHKLALVLQNARTCPEIEITFQDLKEGEQATHVDDSAMADASTTVVVTKHDGKYIVLAGLNIARKAYVENKPFKARLMSSVLLKKARVQEDTGNNQPELRQDDRRVNQRPEFANQRDSENRYSRYAYARGQRRF